ncbi:MAG: trypsin-like peptidase domain-containing protein [Desulfosarcina sp.]|nr:trypsin-like peptidase domain-containing protein [Desulfosarcina sp.]MBC2742418.1 trypsin-like peptidase domain-containing protein [Desulfosarcina sp.]MBC2765328.1 trypsin-like peptidase domain-containing protein [Desulfosarcina sp.]
MRLIIACHLALLITGGTSALGGTLCPDAQKQFPAPASEVVEIISGWLTGQGYSVRRDYPRPGYVHLAAWKSQNEWEITVRPQSALASVATMIHEGATPSIQACRRLREYVDGYLLGTTPIPPPRAERRHQTVPTVVLDRIETAVCIHARSRQQEVQFSGFVVDPDGLVLCTAHDLTGRQRVTVTFYDGVSVPGIVARLDLRRDLALVEFPASARTFVSLSSGRNLLGMGESVFSIGCPNNLRGTLALGTINGPPRLVDDQPLWQVEMDIYPGSSGSPVFDARGQLVAMVKGRYRGTSTVGFLTPLETIIAFLLNENE